MTNRRWAYFLVAGCILGAAGFFLGPTYRRILTEIVGVAGTALTFVRSRHLPPRQRRPWLALSLAGTFFLLGGLVRFALGSTSSGAYAYPSLADPFFFLSYLGLIAAVILLVRLRTGSYRQTAMNLDATIVAAAIAVSEWCIAFGPYVHDASIPTGQRVTSMLYAAVMIVLAGASIRLSVGPGFRNPAFWLLTLGMGITLVADTTASLATAGMADPSIPQTLGPFIFGFWVAAALHPESHRLTETPPMVEERLSKGRLVMLGAALLLLPSVTVWQFRQPRGVDVSVIVVGWITLSLLVLMRLADLVRTKERTAHNEAILRRANAHLATAHDRFEMKDGAMAAVVELLEGVEQFTAFIGIMRGTGYLEVVRTAGVSAHRYRGLRVPREELFWPLRLELGTPSGSLPGDHSYVLPPDTDTYGPGAHHVLLVPLVSLRELRGSIIVTSPKLVHAATRQALEQLASTFALALESASLVEDLHRQQNERRFRALVENSSDIVVVADPDGIVTFASPACRRVLGIDAEKVVGLHAVDLVDPTDRAFAQEVLNRAVAEGGTQLDPIEVRIPHRDGSYLWFEVRVRDLSADPEVGGTVINARDITERKRAEAEIARREARFRALVQHSSDIVAVLDECGCLSYVSPAVVETLGYEPDELEGTSVLDLLDSPERLLVERRSEELEADSRLEASGTFEAASLELQVRHKDGSTRFFDVTITDLRKQAAIGGVVLNARDVTVRKALEHDLRHQALHDSLTGLGNRAMFLHHVREALDRRDPDQCVGVLFIDIDDFKTVNDSLGHAVGDEILVRVADRLKTCLHHADVAARLGGDEFAILVRSPYGAEEITKLAERVLTALRSPFVVQQRDFTLAASVGIAFQDPDSTAELLLRNADMAMYLAKERGKDRYEIFKDDMHATVFERLVLKADLAAGIEGNQLHLCYQPIVSLQTGRITGVEALVRWNHPTRGPLSPAQFVALAEDTGLILPLGQWVLEEACRQLRSWQLRLPPKASLTMSVNLSVRQLVRDDVVNQIAETIHQFQLDPSTITMELTETMLMEDIELSRRRLEELKTLGVSLAVDDFGTGYSSLGYVQQYPIDIIKIDRSFVDGLGERASNDTVVVQTMIEMAQRLGVHIVAEGIEDVAQLRVLQSLGCDLGQGYYFSKPVEADRIGPMLTASIADGTAFLQNGGSPAT